jgi:hypothetical protein
MYPPRISENPDANDARRDAIRYYFGKAATDPRAKEEGPQWTASSNTQPRD